MRLTIIPPPALCTLLRMCEASPLPKQILDCGAGGPVPPLSLFADYGYRCTGIDRSARRTCLARHFAEENDLMMEFHQGDLRRLPYDAGAFSFAYALNTIYHLSKAEARITTAEMGRVLRPGGILYANFLSREDEGFGSGRETAPGEFAQQEDGEEVIHSYYADDEPDHLFEGMHIMMKVKRQIHALHGGAARRRVYLDVYARRLGAAI